MKRPATTTQRLPSLELVITSLAKVVPMLQLITTTQRQHRRTGPVNSSDVTSFRPAIMTPMPMSRTTTNANTLRTATTAMATASMTPTPTGYVTNLRQRAARIQRPAIMMLRRQMMTAPAHTLKKITIATGTVSMTLITMGCVTN